MEFLIIGVVIIFLLNTFKFFYGLKNRNVKSFNLVYSGKQKLVIRKNRFIKVFMFLLSIFYLVISCYALIYFVQIRSVKDDSRSVIFSSIIALFVLIFFFQWKKYRRDSNFVIEVNKNDVIINTIKYSIISIKSLILKKSVNSQGFSYYDILLKVDNKTYWLVSGVNKDEIVELAPILSDLFDIRIKNIEMIDDNLL